MDLVWQLVTEFAGRHHGVITADEAGRLGVATYRLAKWASSGRLVRAAPGTYLVAGAAPTWYQRVRAATSSGGGWASHRAAAALWALDGFDGRVVEIVTERGRRRRRSGWKVHESRTCAVLTSPRPRRSPPSPSPGRSSTCRLWRTPTSWARRSTTRAGATRPLDAVVARHLELPTRGRRGARLLGEMLGERLGTRFTDSDFETATIRLLRSIGVPDPVPQHEVRAGNFVAYIDLAWPALQWFVECDSLAHHFGKASHEWDRSRRRHLKRLGWDGVEVTYDDVTRRARRTGAELRELYELRAAAMTPR
jgi:very-short-patch-repair endonuclease